LNCFLTNVSSASTDFLADELSSVNSTSGSANTNSNNKKKNKKQQQQQRKQNPLKRNGS